MTHGAVKVKFYHCNIGFHPFIALTQPWMSGLHRSLATLSTVTSSVSQSEEGKVHLASLRNMRLCHAVPVFCSQIH